MENQVTESVLSNEGVVDNLFEDYKQIGGQLESTIRAVELKECQLRSAISQRSIEEKLLSQQVEQNKKSLLELQMRYEQLGNEVYNLEQQQDKFIKEGSTTLQEHVQGVVENDKYIDTNISQIDLAISSLHQKSEKLTTEGKTYSDKIKDNANRHKALISSLITRYVDEINALKSEIKNTNNSIEELINQYKMKLTQINNEECNFKSILDQTDVLKNSSIGPLEAQVKMEREEISLAENNLQDLSLNFSKKSAEVTMERDKLKMSKEELEIKIAELKKDIEDLAISIQNEETSMSNNKTVLQEKDNLRAQLNEEIVTLTVQLDENELSITELMNKHSDLKNVEQNMLDVEEKLSQKQSKITDLKQSLVAIKNSLQSVTENIQKTKDDINTCQTRVSDVNKMVESQQNKNNELKIKISLTESQERNLMETISSIEGDTKSLKDLETTKLNLQIKVKLLSEETELMENLLHQTENKRTQLQYKSATKMLQTSVQKAELKLDKEINCVEQLNILLEKLLDDYVELKDENTTLQDNIRTSQRKLDNLKLDLDEELKKSLLQNQVKELNRKIDALNTEIRHTKLVNRKRSEELLSKQTFYTNEITSYKNKRDVLEEEIAELLPEMIHEVSQGISLIELMVNIYVDDLNSSQSQKSQMKRKEREELQEKLSIVLGKMAQFAGIKSFSVLNQEQCQTVVTEFQKEFLKLSSQTSQSGIDALANVHCMGQCIFESTTTVKPIKLNDTFHFRDTSQDT